MKLNALLIKRLLLPFSRSSSQKAQLMLSFLGIVLASFLAFTAVSVGQGYQQVYEKAILGFGAHLVIFKDSGLGEREQKEVRDVLEKFSDQIFASPYHYREVFVRSNSGLNPLILKGVDWDSFQKVYTLNYQWVNETQEGVLLGRHLFDSTKLPSTVTLMTLNDPQKSARTKVMTLPLGGSFTSGYFEYDKSFALISLKELQSHFDIKDFVSGFEVRVASGKMDDILKLQRHLKNHLDESYEIQHFGELNRELYEALHLDRFVVLLVSGLIFPSSH